ncbi:MAG TPA: CPBP family intramembrane glutamic endopeptidase [Myxococcaceae bacterium]|nr:CPBP family intramembrane glutamic endopeptidase [Myxococcaceae bacterium]
MKRAVRWIELGALFGLLPAALATFARGLSLPVLFVAAWLCLAVLWWDPTFQRDELWRREQLWTWLRGPLALALAAGTLLAVGVYLVEPRHLFDLPRNSPWRWLLVMLLYPVLSVVPQELVFRTFFFHRYGRLFRSPWVTTMASAIAFSWAHIVLMNELAVLLTLVGGWLFARTYVRTRSLLATAVEHAAYGCLLFTVGLGRWFVTGA